MKRKEQNKNMNEVKRRSGMEMPFSETPDVKYVYSHVKTSTMNPQFLDKSCEKCAYSLCKNHPNSFHDTLIP